jgi:hypothetical protein
VSQIDSPISKTENYELWLQKAYTAYYSADEKSLIAVLPCPKELRPDAYQDWFIYPRNREYGFIVSMSTIEEIRWYNAFTLLLTIAFLIISFAAFIFNIDKIHHEYGFWLTAAIWASIFVGGLVFLTRPLRRIFAEHERVYFPEVFTNALKKKDRTMLLLTSISKAGGAVVGGVFEAREVHKIVAKAAEMATESAVYGATEHFKSHSKIEPHETDGAGKRDRS